jgi:hypothetical protein
MRAVLGSAVLGLALLTGAGCGSTPAPTCQDATRQVLDLIAAAPVDGALQVTSGKTLQSPDDENLHLVAARATGKDGVERIGVWTTSHLAGEGEILSVDEVAKTLTSYGDAADATNIGPDDAVTADVRKCL